MGRNVNPSSAKDQRFENCYPEISKNSITGNATAYICKRPGFTGTTSAAASYTALTGGVAVNGYTLFPYLNGTTLSLYDQNDAQVGGDITGVTGGVRISETSISGVSNFVVIATKSADSLPHAWYMATGAGAFTEITDIDYPSKQTPALTTRGSMVHMDGYAFIMDSLGRIWNSDLNSIANWTSTSFIDAQMYPDGGSGLARIKNMIVAFGTASVEFFQNTGNATGSPLSRIPTVAQRVGAIPAALNNCETIWSVGDQVYFIGQNADTAARGIFRVSGTSVEKISTPLIDNELMSISGGTPWGISGVFNFNGQRHVVMHTNSSSGTWCYSIDTNTWWYFTSPAITVSNSMASAVPLGVAPQFTTTSARIRYKHDPTSPVYQDNSADYTLKIRTQNIDQGTARKKMYRQVELIADNRSTAGNTYIQWSDDDYGSFSTAQTIDLSTGTRRLTRLGSTNRNYGNRRAWQITDAVNAAFRAQAFDVTYELGSS